MASLQLGLLLQKWRRRDDLAAGCFSARLVTLSIAEEITSPILAARCLKQGPLLSCGDSCGWIKILPIVG